MKMSKPNLKLNLGFGSPEENKVGDQESYDALAGSAKLLSPQISLGIDFTFNTIKNVRKVTWKNESPWYREIQKGFSWFCYCMNKDCTVYR